MLTNILSYVSFWKNSQKNCNVSVKVGWVTLERSLVILTGFGIFITFYSQFSTFGTKTFFYCIFQIVSKFFPNFKTTPNFRVFFIQLCSHLCWEPFDNFFQFSRHSKLRKTLCKEVKFYKWLDHSHVIDRNYFFL